MGPTSHGFFGVGVALALLTACLIAFTASADKADAGDKNCNDFRNQAKAQKFFKKHKPKKDPHGLDADNDGIACDASPCPCNHNPAFRSMQPAESRRTGGFTSCGDQNNPSGLTWFDVKARNVECASARAIAHRYVFGNDLSPAGFRCKDKVTSFHGTKHRCWKGGAKASRQIVKFKSAA